VSDTALVSADWLLENVDAPNVRVLDASWVPPFLKDRPRGTELYETAHIPGAAYFDIDEIADQNTALSHMLPSANVFAEKAGQLGIDNNTHVIAYDSNGFFASARAWWMFRAMGHQQIHVLDGGLEAWRKAGGDVSSETISPEAKMFLASGRDELVRDQLDMQQHVADQDIQILDARDTGRFNGTAPEPRAGLPSGHMPGSFCVPASSLLASDKTLKPADELQPLLAPYLEGQVVTSCGSGVSAAIIALALAQLGKTDAALYDGSWSEWAANPENPIATTT